MNTQRIGLFGGSFDPVHNGHLHIARAFADETGLDTVIFLPAGRPYHKTGRPAAAEHRLAMVELAAAADPRFAVSDCDIVRSGATYTDDTVQIFRQQFPRSELWWLMGADSLMQLHTWKNWRHLVQNTRIAVAERPGQAQAAVPPELRTWMDGAKAGGSLKILAAAPYDTSSSRIRQTLVQGGNADCWLPEAVADYIRRHRLYADAG